MKFPYWKNEAVGGLKMQRSPVIPTRLTGKERMAKRVDICLRKNKGETA